MLALRHGLGLGERAARLTDSLRYSVSRSVPSDYGRGARMAFLFKLETTDGAPADPPTLAVAVPNGGAVTRSRWDAGRCVLKDVA
jgi:hypothetical protein